MQPRRRGAWTPRHASRQQPSCSMQRTAVFKVGHVPYETPAGFQHQGPAQTSSGLLAGNRAGMCSKSGPAEAAQPAACVSKGTQFSIHQTQGIHGGQTGRGLLSPLFICCGGKAGRRKNKAISRPRNGASVLLQGADSRPDWRSQPGSAALDGCGLGAESTLSGLCTGSGTSEVTSAERRWWGWGCGEELVALLEDVAWGRAFRVADTLRR